jgi:DNA-binding LacI/PurR family transcriptional regulator
MGRPPREQIVVNEAIRRQLLDDRLAPGQRLPTRQQLAQRHRVSVMTVQRAMTRLEAEGWIVSRGTQGTFVADRLPYQTRYALLLPYHPADPEYFTLFYQALTAAAEQLADAGECEFEIVHAQRAVLSAADTERVLADARAHRVGGVIFADYPTRLVATSLYREPGLYHVALSFTGEYLGVPVVGLDAAAWFDHAVGAAVAVERSRIACLTACGKDTLWTRAFQRALARYGLTIRPYWQQYADPRVTEWLPELLQLWLALPARERPDTLLLTDDNFVAAATAGLRAAGVAVPEDLLVIGHYNAPCRPEATVPVRWLGYDCVALLRQARAVIDAQRRGDAVATQSVVTPVWGTTREMERETKRSVAPSVVGGGARNRLRRQPEGVKV